MCVHVCMCVHESAQIPPHYILHKLHVARCSHVFTCACMSVSLSVCLSVCPSASDSPERSVQHSALRCQRECVQYKRATETAEEAGGIRHLTSPAREHANP